MKSCAEAATTLTDDMPVQAGPVFMSRDLCHAIDLLRAVPSARLSWRHDVDRLPLRTVIEPARRLSLPPQRPPRVDQLHVRQCSSLNDDPAVHGTSQLGCHCTSRRPLNLTFNITSVYN